jgi:hypothetical protein
MRCYVTATAAGIGTPAGTSATPASTPASDAVGGWDGGEATRNGDGAAAAVATDAVATRNGSKRQRLSGKFPSTVGVFIMCV